MNISPLSRISRSPSPPETVPFVPRVMQLRESGVGHSEKEPFEYAHYSATSHRAPDMIPPLRIFEQRSRSPSPPKTLPFVPRVVQLRESGVGHSEEEPFEYPHYSATNHRSSGDPISLSREPRLPFFMLQGPASPISLAKCRFCKQENVQLTPPKFHCPSCGKIPEALKFIGHVQKYPDEDGAGDGSSIMSLTEANIYFSTKLQSVSELKAAYEERIGHPISEFPILMDCELCGDNYTHWTQICAKRFRTFNDMIMLPSEPKSLSDLVQQLKTRRRLRGGICGLCGEEGHWIGMCRFNRNRTPMKCNICKEEDHRATICPWRYRLPPGKVPPPGYKVACALCCKEFDKFGGVCRPRVVDDRPLSFAAQNLPFPLEYVSDCVDIFD